MHIETVAQSFANYIGWSCLWDMVDDNINYQDCISASYIFYKLCKIYFWNNFDIVIKSWSLREWLDDGSCDFLWNSWHYWCESNGKIYDFTVSQFWWYIEFNKLSLLLPYGSYIFDKEIMNDNNLYTYWIDWFEKCKKLNWFLKNYTDSDYILYFIK